MQQNDILFLMSGGSDNVFPGDSIGGPMSDHHVGDSFNNLFSDVTTRQSFAGHTDYRCFYVLNNHPTEKLKSVGVWAHKKLAGSEVQIGLSLQNEVQALMVKGKPDAGSFQLVYTIKHGSDTLTATTREINWTPDAVTMAQRIRAILNSLSYLGGIEVIGSENNDGFDFLIQFTGPSGGRAQEELGVINELAVDVSIHRTLKGGPINMIAPNIGFPNNPPSGVTFFDTDRSTPIPIGTLFPGDYMPVWIKRDVARRTKAVHPDQFRFHLSGVPDDMNSTAAHHAPQANITKNLKSQSAYF